MNSKLFGVLCVLFSIGIETAGQVNIKKSTLIQDKLKSKLVLSIGVTLMILELFMWNYVLQIVDLSIAYPLSSFGLVLITISSKFYLKEQVCSRRILGVICVLTGGLMVGIS